ncbi:MAG: hypothetical protein AAF788_01780 [Pseudomonadota bacterium]
MARSFEDIVKRYVRKQENRDKLKHALFDLRPFHLRIDHDPLPDDQPALYVGTYHKTGTVWLESTFRTFAAFTDSSFLHRQRPALNTIRQRHKVVFDWKADITAAELTGHRGFRMVRDPRDVIVSGMHYHRKTKEKWCHVPSDTFGGRSYQEAINQYNDEDALLFEIDNKGGEIIQRMLDFDGNDDIRTVHYETFIADKDLLAWHELLHWAGLRRYDLFLAQQALYERSLFGLAGKNNKHIRSGAARQWEEAFTPKVMDHFKASLGDAPQKLGYQSISF